MNISGVHFLSDGFVEPLIQLLERHQIAPSRLHLEITETSILRDVDSALVAVKRLRDQGIKVFMDDFGTGYSSLSHLAKFPLDGLKIDVSFIRGVPGDDIACGLTRGIIALAKNLNLEVVAEGVETPAQYEFLLAHDCDFLQGYYFGYAAELPKPAQLPNIA